MSQPDDDISRINTECGGCRTIGPYSMRPDCPICGHHNDPEEVRAKQERCEEERHFGGYKTKDALVKHLIIDHGWGLAAAGYKTITRKEYEQFHRERHTEDSAAGS
jgi:hypothetical protein